MAPVVVVGTINCVRIVGAQTQRRTERITPRPRVSGIVVTHGLFRVAVAHIVVHIGFVADDAAAVLAGAVFVRGLFEKRIVGVVVADVFDPVARNTAHGILPVAEAVVVAHELRTAARGIGDAQQPLLLVGRAVDLVGKTVRRHGELPLEIVAGIGQLIAVHVDGIRSQIEQYLMTGNVGRPSRIVSTVAIAPEVGDRIADMLHAVGEGIGVVADLHRLQVTLVTLVDVRLREDDGLTCDTLRVADHDTLQHGIQYPRARVVVRLVLELRIAATESDPVDVVAFDPFADRRRILRLIGQLLPEEIRRAVALVVPAEEQRTRIDDRAIALLTRVAGGIADLIIGSVKLSAIVQRYGSGCLQHTTTVRKIRERYAAASVGALDLRTFPCRFRFYIRRDFRCCIRNGRAEVVDRAVRTRDDESLRTQLVEYDSVARHGNGLGAEFPLDIERTAAIEQFVIESVRIFIGTFSPEQPHPIRRGTHKCRTRNVGLRNTRMEVARRFQVVHAVDDARDLHIAAQRPSCAGRAGELVHSREVVEVETQVHGQLQRSRSDGVERDRDFGNSRAVRNGIVDVLHHRHRRRRIEMDVRQIGRLLRLYGRRSEKQERHGATYKGRMLHSRKNLG